MPDTNDVVLTVSATATSGLVTAHGSPAAVGVTCDVVDTSGQSETITVSAAQAGVAVATGNAVVARARALTVCVTMTALYSENVFVWTERSCLTSDDLVRQSLVP